MMKKEDWRKLVNECETTINNAENVIAINASLLGIALQHLEDCEEEETELRTEKPILGVQ